MFMNLWRNFPPGPKGKFPDEIHVVIEVPMGTANKYEVDLETGVIFLDRSLHTSSVYPGDYGFVPQTLALDGDAIDVLVLTVKPTFPYCVVRAKPIGLLKMRDEKGEDNKVIAVPVTEPRLSHIKTIDDLGEHRKKELSHFFQHYKDLEEGKWVEFLGFGGPEDAKKELLDANRAFWELIRSKERI